MFLCVCALFIVFPCQSRGHVWALRDRYKLQVTSIRPFWEEFFSPGIETAQAAGTRSPNRSASCIVGTQHSQQERSEKHLLCRFPRACFHFENERGALDQRYSGFQAKAFKLKAQALPSNTLFHPFSSYRPRNPKNIKEL